MRAGMRVVSAFQAMRSLRFSRSPIRYSRMRRVQIRSRECRNWNEPGHLRAAVEALAARDLVEVADLAFVDEQAQLAGLGEVGLRRQQGQRLAAAAGPRRPSTPPLRPSAAAAMASSVPPRQ